MKKLFTVLFLFLATYKSFASDPRLDYSKEDPSTFVSGVVLVKVKPEYKSSCSSNGINIPKVMDVISSISGTAVYKKFPKALAPSTELNKSGRQPVDLSLIYKIEFSPVVKVSEAIRLLNNTSAFLAVEPSYIHKMNFTPNDPDLGSQYHITRINALLAWDVWTGDTNVVIGIVDSGTDWDHPDLEGNIKYNYADPIDGIDNDNDGFTDNFRGWDVSENDNDPMVVSSEHGSHVSGCAAAVTNNSTGVASPGFNCKFLPVKSCLDASTTSIDNGYDGIVYAADHGANVINCSWGRTGLKSTIEEDVINYALFDKDALVVCSAGNDGQEIDQYPSSYINAISVASTTNTDSKSNFSDYEGSQIDVCAPGSNIYSTVFNNSYTQMSGTSMASPVAAGCAAMIKSRFPALTARQVGEQMRSTCDNIYSTSGNGGYLGKLGKGRVNLFRAVTDSLSPGVILKSHKEIDGNDNAFLTGDTLSIIALFENILRPTTNLTCSLVTNTNIVQILQSNFTPGVLATNDTVSNFNAAYRVYIKPTAPLNSEVAFRILLTDGAWSDMFLFKITVNVDYVNIAVNDVATSISSRGLIGYNQTGQTQGLGFTYKNSSTMLYDMTLMTGAQGSQVSDNGRSVAANDDDFHSRVNVSGREPGLISDFDATGSFADDGSTSATPLNLLITHHAYAWINPPDNKYVMIQYSIKNTGTAPLNNFYAGLFADWDIMDFDNNKCSTDAGRRMGYIYSTDSAGLYGGIKLLSNSGTFNHYSIDNTAANGGIEMTDGFDNSEKYTALSTGRADAGTATVPGNDVLSCVSTGTGTLNAGDSVVVAFALIGGEDLSSIQQSADAAQEKYNGIFIGIDRVDDANSNHLFPCYPNPAGNEVRISFSLSKSVNTKLEIINYMGVIVKTVLNENLQTGKYTSVIDVNDLAAGNYFYRLSSGSFHSSLPITIVNR